MATVEFISGIQEEISEIKLSRGANSGNRIVMFIFEKLNAFDKMTNLFSGAGASYMLLNDEEGDIRVSPRNLRFLYKNDDNLARVECDFELVNDEQWQRIQRFLERYAKSNGMEYQERRPKA